MQNQTETGIINETPEGGAEPGPSGRDSGTIFRGDWRGEETMELEPTRPIGVFDSGVGGLSVLRALRRQLPQEDFLYFGDSRQAPYGTKTASQVRQLTRQHVGNLFQRGVKAVVIACNTATSAAIDCLRQEYPDRILVGIEPALKLAVEKIPQGRIVVMGTQMTLQEQKFAQLLARYAGEREIIPLACSGLVELIESGILEGPQMEDYLRQKLSAYLDGLGGIVLGCTHYPFVKKAIAQVVGEQVALLDGSEGAARQTRKRLEQAGLLRQEGDGRVTVENSLNTSEILALSQRLLNL